MRFAISALSVVAIASSIGTLLRQREPYPAYVNQFGPFWADIFRSIGIYEVYNAWWFIAIMAFLVISTAVCVTRNTPKFLRDMRSWQSQIRLNSLRAMPNRGEAQVSTNVADTVSGVSKLLRSNGFRLREEARDDGVLLAAKAGTLNRLGYIFAHSGIVVVCLGGLADSELPLRAAISWLDKTPLPAALRSDQVPEVHRLPASNPSYRANLFVVEGQSNDKATMAMAKGTYLQDLPFTVNLKKFRVDYYSSGMPKLFASDVQIIRKDGSKFDATIKVNEPLIEQGIALYQSSFDDGGSHLVLRSIPLDGGAQRFSLKGDVGDAIALKPPAATPATSASPATSGPLSLELMGLRVINVENMKQVASELVDEKAPVSAQNKFKESVATVLSPAGGSKSRDLKNVGPSVQYKLRDAAGQAREFNVYMQPMQIDGDSFILAGVRENPNEAFRYLRIPADDKDSADEFVRLRHALTRQDWIATAAQRFADKAAPAPAPTTSGSAASSAPLKAQLAATAQRATETFARGGLQEVSRMLEASVPKAEQEKAAEVFLRVLSGMMWQLWQVSREQAALPALDLNDPKQGRFLQLAQSALSDSFLVGSPVLFQLDTFEQVQASVLQVTRSPGKFWVYLGSLMLVLGVFAMFYLRERRVWCYVQNNGTVTYAMSAPRKTMMTQQEFERLKAQLTTHLAPKTL